MAVRNRDKMQDLYNVIDNDLKSLLELKVKLNLKLNLKIAEIRKLVHP